MTETWMLLKFLDRNLDESYVGPPYAIEGRLDFEEPPRPGVELCLIRGGWVTILWVDAKHRQIGVEHISPSTPWRSGRHL